MMHKVLLVVVEFDLVVDVGRNPHRHKKDQTDHEDAFN